ncbi:ABC transporter permease [Paenibacillus beijingensis]|uniref:Nitrate transport permease nrtB n=1 Tax=Paenibacillus beijingensis TaxID=1126833 RepID=A0A0D5NG11_9BACL|nr:ABC transporter permease [Paenibacillus beijingensis]AJY74181.1 nitrate transport permease nrtB [Paenibacillus beijingensis]
MKKYSAISAASILLVLAIWAYLTYSNTIDKLFLPTPGDTLQALVDEIREGIFFEDLAVSFYRILMGFLISTIFAVPIGMMMATSRTWQAIWEPLIGLIRYMPAVAFIPLSILWFGTSDLQKFFILFLGVFFQEVIMIADNCKTVNKSLVEVGKTLGLSKGEVMKSIVFRAALPGMVDTFRTTWGWAWTYLVVAELVAASEGLGFRIMQAQRYLATERIVLGIVVIGLLGLITDLLFAGLYKKLFPWKALEKAKG